MSVNQLPAGFEAMEPFVARWALNTTSARLNVRAQSSYEEIRAFYDAMVPHTEAAIELIDRHKLDALPPDVEKLACLVLALAQTAMAIEIHDAAVAPGTSWPAKLQLMQGAVPLG